MFWDLLQFHRGEVVYNLPILLVGGGGGGGGEQGGGGGGGAVFYSEQAPFL